jgi:hypothetical protein
MRRLLLGGFILMACGSGSNEPTKAGSPGTDPTPSPICSVRVGLYQATSVTTAGNCGILPNVVVRIEEIDGPAMGCSVVQETKPEGGCETLINLRCVLDNGAIATVRRYVKWAGDGKTGTGTVNLDIAGSGACAGAYSITYQKT